MIIGARISPTLAQAVKIPRVLALSDEGYTDIVIRTINAKALAQEKQATWTKTLLNPIGIPRMPIAKNIIVHISKELIRLVRRPMIPSVMAVNIKAAISKANLMK